MEDTEPSCWLQCPLAFSYLCINKNMGWTGISISQNCFLQDVHTNSFSYVKGQEKPYSVWTKCTGIHSWPRSRGRRASSPPLAKLRKIPVFVTHWASKRNFCKNKVNPLAKSWTYDFILRNTSVSTDLFLWLFLCSCFIQTFSRLLTIDAYLSSLLLIVSHNSSSI